MPTAKNEINALSTKQVTTEYAETIAAQALAFLSQDKRAFEGFLATTGIDVSQIRSFADDPQFLAGVLDYTLSREQLVAEFCEAAGIDPEVPRAARQQLPGATINT